jgi:hypothetical protein
MSSDEVQTMNTALLMRAVALAVTVPLLVLALVVGCAAQHLREANEQREQTCGALAIALQRIEIEQTEHCAAVASLPAEPTLTRARVLCSEADARIEQAQSWAALLCMQVPE